MSEENASIACVIGGAGKIGRLISFRLVEAGVRVAILDRDVAKATDVADDICDRYKSDRALAIGVDISQIASLKSAQEVVTAKWGPADILINGAGPETGYLTGEVISVSGGLSMAG